MTTTVVNNLVFRGFFEKQKLTGPKFIDCKFLPKTLADQLAWVKGQKEIVVLMLMTMEPDLQRNLETLGAYDMLKELKTLFSQQAEQELLQTVREFHACKQEEGQSVSSYVLKMKSYIDNLERLGHPVSLNLAVSLILVSLRKEYDSFVQNYNMHGMGKTVNELHAMLKLHEQTLPKRDAPALHAIRAGKVNDMGCGTQICNTTQGLRGSRKLKPGDLSLYMGVILVSRLYDDGFINRFDDDNTILVSRNNLVYFSDIPWDGIYEIDLSNSNTNDRSMYNVINKRAKLNLDSSLLWHYHLGHISKKHIEKLQHDGLLDSIDTKYLEKCVSCLSRKMARKPYSHQVERAKDLLGLIHTDVRGPFRIVSSQGASYFVTFTDDFNRYGYVYLLKHIHEVFETFKVFQKEVENQLEKTIKSLRSNRGGEYISQEFLDHLKEHGIIAHRTPSYTPQHNDVSKRRNRTLLDMVCSMMSQTTLPGSFWDYALESATRILNMVPTKKVEKTPYEVWYRQALKLSYLKVWGCEALVKRDTLTKPDKLEPRSINCIFVGYAKEIIGYSFYYPPENKVFVARNAEFFENSLITQEASGSLEDLKLSQEEDTHPSKNTSSNHDEDNQEINEPQSDIIPIRRSTRTRHAPDRMCLNIEADEYELGDLNEPANYKAALLDPESDKWLNAMNVEMQSMKDNEVWDLVDLPPNGKTVGSKWLFKKKTDMDGAVHTFKARLVAKGYTQTLEIDYEETFSPVA
ncbi:retrotransposon protein, putative, ty1-copia subclass, partial [Tanacetum coccineum]